MRLLQQLPELPEGEGSFWTHNTGGEHATKFIGYEEPYNQLAEDSLVRQDGDQIDLFTSDMLQNFLADDDSEVIFIRHQSEGGDFPETLVAGAVANFEPTQQGTRTFIEEIVVHPNFRNHKLASYMLGRFMVAMPYGMPAPIELVFDTTTYETEEWFKDRLVDAGFRHITEDGSLGMWLPGIVVAEEWLLMNDMPEDFTGYVEKRTEAGIITEVYRESELVGSISQVSDKGYYDGELDTYFARYELYDSEGNLVDTLDGYTHQEAIIQLLNPEDKHVRMVSTILDHLRGNLTLLNNGLQEGRLSEATIAQLREQYEAEIEAFEELKRTGEFKNYTPAALIERYRAVQREKFHPLYDKTIN